MIDLHGRKAVVADPLPLWIEAVAPIVETLGFVVQTALSPGDALALVEAEHPDLLVTELKFDADGEGIDLIRRAREVVPEVRVIVLSMASEPSRIDAALGDGATAYVVKTAHPDDLRSAVRQAFNLSIYIRSERPLQVAHSSPPAEVPELTRRELEILQLVAEGHSNSQLARLLWVTEQTVKFHLSNVYRKLDVANRTEASRWAQLHGLLPSKSGDNSAA
jgi:DNA-binding NarL/FixJ family response regulator